MRRNEPVRGRASSSANWMPEKWIALRFRDTVVLLSGVRSPGNIVDGSVLCHDVVGELRSTFPSRSAAS